MNAGRSSALAALIVGLSGCTASPSDAARASATASAEPPPSVAPSSASSSSQGIPKTEADIARVVNPDNAAPYAGPTATLRGHVTIVGDAPPDVALELAPECTGADAMYGKLFRRGPNGELADAMVAVTRYKGFVPAATQVRQVTVAGCAFDTRTVVATFGQRIDVANTDAVTTYMPYLDGAPFRAMLVALPKSRPVQLFPFEPGHYLLRDVLPRPFEIADVFVVPYATFDVTSTAGVFTVAGIPVGRARVDAFLPVINKSVGKDVELVEGVNDLDLELRFDATVDKPVPIPPAVWGDRGK